MERERGRENGIHVPDCSQSSLAIQQHQASVEILHELSPGSFPEEQVEQDFQNNSA